MNVKIFSPNDFPAYLPKLNQLYDELFAGGKGFRSKLVQIVAGPLSLDEKSQNLLCQTIEFIHNSSLLHDDLIDQSQLRRGKTAAWVKYTPEYAVLAGDYLLARVMVNLSAHGNIRLVQYTAEVISDLLEGEWLQDSVVGDFFVSLTQLDRIHNLKTASLFKWCLRAPFITKFPTEAEHSKIKDIHHLLEESGTLLGQMFQRSDDLLDYNIRNYENKEILGDLKSGYLNSFGAFVSQDLSRTQIDLMIKSKNLPEFYEALGGEAIFQKKLQEFDQINAKLISLYQHHLLQLEGLLEPQQKVLVEKLKVLPELLYWRKTGQ